MEERIIDAIICNDINNLKNILTNTNSNSNSNTPNNLNFSFGDNGYTPLHYACLTNNEEIVGYILDCGVYVDVTDKFGCTPLHLCCYYSLNYICYILLNYGADINKISYMGKSSLDYYMEGLKSNQKEIIEKISVKFIENELEDNLYGILLKFGAK